MLRRLLYRLAAVMGLVTLNLVLIGSRPSFVAAAEDWGQCELFGGPGGPHCHCVAPLTETNCSGDGDCNFGPCDVE